MGVQYLVDLRSFYTNKYEVVGDHSFNFVRRRDSLRGDSGEGLTWPGNDRSWNFLSDLSPGVDKEKEHNFDRNFMRLVEPEILGQETDKIDPARKLYREAMVALQNWGYVSGENVVLPLHQLETTELLLEWEEGVGKLVVKKGLFCPNYKEDAVHEEEAQGDAHISPEDGCENRLKGEDLLLCRFDEDYGQHGGAGVWKIGRLLAPPPGAKSKNPRLKSRADSTPRFSRTLYKSVVGAGKPVGVKPTSEGGVYYKESSDHGEGTASAEESSGEEAALSTNENPGEQERPAPEAWSSLVVDLEFHRPLGGFAVGTYPPVEVWKPSLLGKNDLLGVMSYDSSRYWESVIGENVPLASCPLRFHLPKTPEEKKTNRLVQWLKTPGRTVANVAGSASADLAQESVSVFQPLSSDPTAGAGAPSKVSEVQPQQDQPADAAGDFWETTGWAGKCDNVYEESEPLTGLDVEFMLRGGERANTLKNAFVLNKYGELLTSDGSAQEQALMAVGDAEEGGAAPEGKQDKVLRSGDVVSILEDSRSDRKKMDVRLLQKKLPNDTGTTSEWRDD